MTINGRTKRGRGLGKKIGFPTLNIDYDGELRGVFVGKVLLDEKWRPAAVHLGEKPTFGDVKPICEVCILNWEGSVEPGTQIEVEVDKKIRGLEKFANVGDLKKQLAKDIEFAKMSLK